MTTRHRPVRSCIGCGRKAPKDELVRFVAAAGAVVGAGTHEQLLQDCPTYIEIVESQLGVEALA